MLSRVSRVSRVGKLSRYRKEAAPRDMAESSFSRTLSDLVRRFPGCYGAVLVDMDGEAVDYAGREEPFELRMAAAHLQIVSAQVRDAPIRSLLFRAEGGSFLLHRLPDGYALVLLLHRGAGFLGAPRALSVAERLLSTDAGWGLRVPLEDPWFVVDVMVDDDDRPRWVIVENKRERATVIGRLVDLPGYERGFRVRLDSGMELTLIREPSKVWFTPDVVA